MRNRIGIVAGVFGVTAIGATIGFALGVRYVDEIDAWVMGRR